MEPDIKAAIAGLRDWLSTSENMGEAAPRLTSVAKADLLAVIDYAAEIEAFRDRMRESLSGFARIDTSAALATMTSGGLSGDQSSAILADMISKLEQGGQQESEL